MQCRLFCPTCQPTIPSKCVRKGQRENALLRARQSPPRKCDSRCNVYKQNSSDVTVQDENSNLDVTEPSEPAGLQTIQNNLSISKGWTRLDVPDLDGLLYATTTVSKHLFAIAHKKLLMFTNGNGKQVFACFYFHERESKANPINYMKEAAETSKQADGAILCK